MFPPLQLFYILKKGKDSISSKELCGLVKGGDCAEYSKVLANFSLLSIEQIYDNFAHLCK